MLEGLNALVVDGTTPPVGESDAIVLDGHLLRGGSTTLRVLLGNLFVDILVEDVLSIEERGRATPAADFGVPVRVVARRPLRLIDAGPSWPYLGLFKGGRRTFASSSRPPDPVKPHSSHYRDLEQAFLRKHGLGSIETG